MKARRNLPLPDSSAEPIGWHEGKPSRAVGGSRRGGVARREASADSGELEAGYPDHELYATAQAPSRRAPAQPGGTRLRKVVFWGSLVLAASFAVAPSVWFVARGPQIGPDPDRLGADGDDSAPQELGSASPPQEQPEPEPPGTARRAQSSVLAPSAGQVALQAVPSMLGSSLPGVLSAVARPQPRGVPAGTFDGLFADLALGPANPIEPESARPAPEAPAAAGVMSPSVAGAPVDPAGTGRSELLAARRGGDTAAVASAGNPAAELAVAQHGPALKQSASVLPPIVPPRAATHAAPGAAVSSAAGDPQTPLDAPTAASFASPPVAWGEELPPAAGLLAAAVSPAPQTDALRSGRAPSVLPAATPVDAGRAEAEILSAAASGAAATGAAPKAAAAAKPRAAERDVNPPATAGFADAGSAVLRSVSAGTQTVPAFGSEFAKRRDSSEALPAASSAATVPLLAAAFALPPSPELKQVAGEELELLASGSPVPITRSSPEAARADTGESPAPGPETRQAVALLTPLGEAQAVKPAAAPVTTPAAGVASPGEAVLSARPGSLPVVPARSTAALFRSTLGTALTSEPFAAAPVTLSFAAEPVLQAQFANPAEPALGQVHRRLAPAAAVAIAAAERSPAADGLAAAVISVAAGVASPGEAVLAAEPGSLPVVPARSTAALFRSTLGTALTSEPFAAARVSLSFAAEPVLQAQFADPGEPPLGQAHGRLAPAAAVASAAAERSSAADGLAAAVKSVDAGAAFSAVAVRGEAGFAGRSAPPIAGPEVDHAAAAPPRASVAPAAPPPSIAAANRNLAPAAEVESAAFFVIASEASRASELGTPTLPLRAAAGLVIPPSVAAEAHSATLLRSAAIRQAQTAAAPAGPQPDTITGRFLSLAADGATSTRVAAGPAPSVLADAQPGSRAAALAPLPTAISAPAAGAEARRADPAVLAASALEAAPLPTGPFAAREISAAPPIADMPAAGPALVQAPPNPTLGASPGGAGEAAARPVGTTDAEAGTPSRALLPEPSPAPLRHATASAEIPAAAPDSLRALPNPAAVAVVAALGEAALVSFGAVEQSQEAALQATLPEVRLPKPRPDYLAAVPRAPAAPPQAESRERRQREQPAARQRREAPPDRRVQARMPAPSPEPVRPARVRTTPVKRSAPAESAALPPQSAFEAVPTLPPSLLPTRPPK